MSTLEQVSYLVALAAAVASAGRWLRVCQREHYLPGSVTRFAWRWWWLHTRNRLLLLIALAAAIATAFVGWLVALTAITVLVGPLGLTHHGRTSSLNWTRRLMTVTSVVVVLVGTGLAATAFSDNPLPAVTLGAVAILLPALIDLVLLVVKPIEHWLTLRWVRKAQARLDSIDPIRVAITGSYGKTTVKIYLGHLLGGTHSVVASPASFNNTAGLCRAVNEYLTNNTEVFIAEMGTYGRGEIAAMTRWVRPSISILTAVGPVHLERFGKLTTTVAAKTEIFATSRIAVVNVDTPLLEAEAQRLSASGITVIRCSAAGPADVHVWATGTDYSATSTTSATPTTANTTPTTSTTNTTPTTANTTPTTNYAITLFGRRLDTTIGTETSPSNIACAVAAAVALGVTDAKIAERLATLPATQHRRHHSVSPSGITVIDDTYNSNPAGAAAALEMLAATPAQRRVVITPGMVELGSVQFKENVAFAQAASEGIADDLLIVGLTNRAALVHGTYNGNATVHLVDNLAEAVSWVRANLQPGDAVLYENDLPDHYP